MTGVRIPIHETAPRVLDTGATVMVPVQLADLQLILRWALHVHGATRDIGLVCRLLKAHALLADVPPALLEELGFCRSCLLSLPCDVCGEGT